MGQITLQRVRKSFGPVNIIKNANLDIENGSFVVFVGPSGCGKTTLLRLIAGLEDVTGGQILIDGHNVVDVPPAKRGLSMVFQSYALYPHMSVRGNIAFGLKMAGLPRPEIDRKVEAAAATLKKVSILPRRDIANVPNRQNDPPEVWRFTDRVIVTIRWRLAKEI